MPIARVFGHRGFTHSLLAVIAGIALFQVDAPLNGVLPRCISCHDNRLFQPSIGRYDYASRCAAIVALPLAFQYSAIAATKGNQLERVLCVLLVCFSVYWQTDTTIPLLYYMEQLKALGYEYIKPYE